MFYFDLCYCLRYYLDELVCKICACIGEWISCFIGWLVIKLVKCWKCLLKWIVDWYFLIGSD